MIRSFRAHMRPPVYSIIEVGTPKTKRELAIINEELAKAGTDVRVYFSKSRSVGTGTPTLRGPGVNEIVLNTTFIVVTPDRRIMQTNYIGNFAII